MIEQHVTFPCRDFELEGVLGLPEGNQSPSPAVIVCHPHSQMGGSMDNNVVYAACRAAEEQSIIWLRFNFRGVGRSGGSFGEGIGEQEDVKAALTYLSALDQIDESRIGLCGYSFGTMAGIPVAHRDDRVQALAAISPFFTEPGLLQNYTKPKLFIAGGQDSLLNLPELKAVLRNLPEPKKLEVIAIADHFWRGLEGRLENLLGEFFKNSLVKGL